MKNSPNTIDLLRKWIFRKNCRAFLRDSKNIFDLRSRSNIDLEDKEYSKKYSPTVALWGDESLHQWVLANELLDRGFNNPFQQLFKIQRDSNQILPLYSFEQIKKKRAEHDRKTNHYKEIENKKKVFMAQLKQPLPPHIKPVAEGIANAAREIEHFLYTALRKGDLEQAQQLIDKGADVNRSYYEKTQLDHAILGYFPKGTIPFLIKNNASLENASLDNALFFGRSVKEVKLLIEKGIKIEDPDLALYRSIQRDKVELVDLFLTKGADINAFINGRAMIFSVSYGNNKMWNHLIDKGAKGRRGQDLAKR